MVSKSASLAFHEVMDALGKDDVNMIGLYGMGGIGKTTLVEHVRKEAERSKIFDYAVMVADFLNLNLIQETEEGRASKLNQRLEREKILIILDDVWEKFDLAKIGIFGDECNGCKILLTTRRLHVCNSMRCQTKIELDLLSEAEAWELFRNKANVQYDPKSNEVVKQIVGECGRLPIALATLGSALREKDINDLVEALKKLRDVRLVDIPEVDGDGKNAYKCLRVSYDYLKCSTLGEAQFLLLLCSLFPEDHEISMEDLTRCAFGMRLFERVDSVQDARGEVGVTVQCLIDSCLLLGTDKKGVVKIHDVVRDVALWIGGTESWERSVFVVRDGRDMRHQMKKERIINCRAISLMPKSISELTNYELVCPKLETMLIFSGSRALGLSDAFFEHTTTLKVLDVRSHGIEGRCHFSVPQSLQDLTDLRTVNLRRCQCSNSSFMGELKILEVLSVIDSTVDCAIEAVIKKMKKLKLLDLTHPAHYVVPRRRKLSSNVIKELSNLEELYTYPRYSFGEWKSYGGERTESCNIVELYSIPNLVRLTIHNKNWRSLPIDYCFPNLECYSITLAERTMRTISVPKRYDRVLLLDEMEEGSQLNAFKNLFPTVEYLRLGYSMLGAGEGFKNIIPCWVNALVASEGFLKNLKELEVVYSGDLEALFEFEGQDSKYVPQHHLLQRLTLKCLSELKHIWKGPRRFVSLCNLTHVEIRDCPKLKIIFSSAICITPSLQQLSISSCGNLEEVISASADPDDDFSSCFQNLRRLIVTECRNLKAIFPMHVMMMPRPRFHLPKLEEIYLQDDDELELVFDHQTVAETEQWPSLKYLSVRGCPKLSSQLVANIQTQLQAPSKAKQLRTIQLGSMQGVEKLIPLQSRDEDDLELLAFHLQKLELDNLQDLKCVWTHAKHNICFSYLTQVKVSSCNRLKQLFTVTIAPSLKQLKRLEVLDCNELEEITSIDESQRKKGRRMSVMMRQI